MPVDRPTPPTMGSIVVTLLLFAAAVLMVAMFFVPLRSVWFWPVAGGFAVCGGLAMAVPLKKR